jgi:hypothetical protein
MVSIQGGRQADIGHREWRKTALKIGQASRCAGSPKNLECSRKKIHKE